MEPRLTLITLGVADVARARRFYEALGFKAARASEESVAFLPAGGVVLALRAVRRSRRTRPLPTAGQASPASPSPIMRAARPKWIKQLLRRWPQAPN